MDDSSDSRAPIRKRPRFTAVDVLLVVLVGFVAISSYASHEIKPGTMGCTHPLAVAQFAVVIFSILCIGILSLTEIGLVSVNRPRIRSLAAGGHPSAQTLVRLFEEKREDYLGAIALAIDFAVILTANQMTAVSLATVGPRYVPELALATVITSLVIGEIIPKSYASHRAERVVLRLTPAIASMANSGIFRATLTVIHFVARPIHVLFGSTEKAAGLRRISREELLAVAEVGEEEGILEAEEAEMFRGILSFGERTAREVMVPRVDVVAIEVSASLDEAADLMARSGKSRIPVFEGDLDNILGVLYARDVLSEYQAVGAPRQAGGGRTVREIMRPPLFVPETKRIDELFAELRRGQVHVALVIDEHGGFDGLVTIEDILEEIFGEVIDEHDLEEAGYVSLDPNTIVIQGKLDRYTAEEVLGIEFPEGDFDTIGGFMLEQLQIVPDPGARAVYGDIEFTVTQTDGPRITQIRAARLTPRPASRSGSDSERS